eukprot:291153-Amphidinium_carterae.2
MALDAKVHNRTMSLPAQLVVCAMSITSAQTVITKSAFTSTICALFTLYAHAFTSWHPPWPRLGVNAGQQLPPAAAPRHLDLQAMEQ